jgi:hypothetical protein
MLRDNKLQRNLNEVLSNLEEIGNQILRRVARICTFGSTNQSPNDLGIEKYIKVNTLGDKTPWTTAELIGLPAALAVEKIFHEKPDYFRKNNFDIVELYNMAYAYGVANCEGMAACAYVEARKMGLFPVKYIRFNPTKESTMIEELNCIIIGHRTQLILVNPWDGMTCKWPNSNNVRDVPELSIYHGHSMEIRKEANFPSNKLICVSPSFFDSAIEMSRIKNIELIKLKASTYQTHSHLLTK